MLPCRATFYATADRAFTDYIYSREKLASLAGKKLQPKRNYVNRFTKLYPDFTTEPLTSKDIDECIALDAQWVDTKAAENEAGRYTFDAERQSLITAPKHWDVLEGRGMVLRVNGKIVAFTYGAPINYDTFGVCVEKSRHGLRRSLCHHQPRIRAQPATAIHPNQPRRGLGH